MVYGYIAQWAGSDRFVRISSNISGGTSEVEIRGGSLLWFPETGGVWIDTIFSSTVDPQMKQYAEQQQWVTRDQYRQMVKSRREAACPVDAPILDAAVSAPPHLAPLIRMGVRFS